jgi:hypothetical protein
VKKMNTPSWIKRHFKRYETDFEYRLIIKLCVLLISGSIAGILTALLYIHLVLPDHYEIYNTKP